MPGDLVGKQWTWSRGTRACKVARKASAPYRAAPVNRLLYERNSEVNPPSYLRGEFLESFGPERDADRCAAAGSSGEQRRDGIRVKSDRLIRDPEIPIELLELATQSRETARHRSGVADVVVRAEETIEALLPRALTSVAFRTFGRFCPAARPFAPER